MLRLKIECLRVECDEYYLANELYSGIGFVLAGNGDVTSHVFDDGKLTGHYHSHSAIGFNANEYVDFLSLEGDPTINPECLYIKAGSPYSGFAFLFEGNYCKAELSFEAGFLSDEIRFFEKGDIQYADVTGQNITQMVCYQSDRNLKELGVHIGGEFRMKARFSDQMLLQSLSFNGCGLDLVQSHEQDLLFRVSELIREDGTFNFFTPDSERLFLSGKAISDSLLERLVPVKKRRDLNELVLYKTSVTQEGVNCLISDGVKNICIEL